MVEVMRRAENARLRRRSLCSAGIRIYEPAPDSVRELRLSVLLSGLQASSAAAARKREHAMTAPHFCVGSADGDTETSAPDACRGTKKLRKTFHSPFRFLRILRFSPSSTMLRVLRFLIL